MSYTSSRTWRANSAIQAETRRFSTLKVNLLKDYPESDVAKWNYKSYVEHQLEMTTAKQKLEAARLREREEQAELAKMQLRPPLPILPFLGKPLPGNTAAVHGADETVFCVDWQPPNKYVVPWPEKGAYEYEGDKRVHTPYKCNFNRMLPMLRELSNDTVAWYKCPQYYASPLDERYRQLTFEDIYYPPEDIEPEETNEWLQSLIKDMETDS